MIIKDLGKTVAAALLIASIAMPVAAAEPAGKPIVSATSKKKAKSKKRLAPSSYRGYAPTYADSVSADDPTYDDPIVRQAAVEFGVPCRQQQRVRAAHVQRQRRAIERRTGAVCRGIRFAREDGNRSAAR